MSCNIPATSLSAIKFETYVGSEIDEPSRENKIIPRKLISEFIFSNAAILDKHARIVNGPGKRNDKPLYP